MILRLLTNKNRSKAREGSGWIARERMKISRSCVPHKAVEDGRSGSHADRMQSGQATVKDVLGERESAEDVPRFS